MRIKDAENDEEDDEIEEGVSDGRSYTPQSFGAGT